MRYITEQPLVTTQPNVLLMRKILRLRNCLRIISSQASACSNIQRCKPSDIKAKYGFQAPASTLCRRTSETSHPSKVPWMARVETHCQTTCSLSVGAYFAHAYTTEKESAANRCSDELLISPSQKLCFCKSHSTDSPFSAAAVFWC
jgi:hypothetical protein